MAISDPDRPAALLCRPGLFTGGARKAVTEALPWLAVSAALALLWWFTRLKLTGDT